MSYTPTTWHGGDVLSAEAMNKIEQGIANSGSGTLVVHETFSSNTHTLDKTWQEIYNAFPNVVLVFTADLGNNYSQGFKTSIIAVVYDEYDEIYTVQAIVDNESIAYHINSPNGYPLYTSQVDS